MKLLASLLTSLLFLTSPAVAQSTYTDCDNAGSEWAKGHCWATALEEAKRNLHSISELVTHRIDNATYLSVVERDKWKQHVELANKAWIAYRDAECYSFRFGGEQGRGRTEMACKTIKTEQRIEELVARYELHGEWRRNTTTVSITEHLNIEVTNRTPISTPLPQYRGDKKGEIRMKIWINPDGSVTRQVVVKKGHPELELAAVNAIRNWQFNALPSHEPQEYQEGTVVFRFGE